MALKIEENSIQTAGLCSVVFDEDLTIYAIEALKHDMSKAIESYKCFELNLASVEEIDSAGIQLLLGLKREITRQDKELKLTVMSAPVTKLIKMYGLVDCFDIGEAL
jgi:anti-anti-sigma factor